MSTYKIHEPISFTALLAIIAILQFYRVQFEVIQLVGSWIFGTLYLSPDLDANYSMPLNRIGYLKYAFTFCRHHGIMHSPYLWCLIFFLFGIAGHPFIGLGLFGSAIVHVGLDYIF